MRKLSRRTGYMVLGAILVAGTTTLWGIASSGDEGAFVRAAASAEVVVYKSPTCGCCEGWVEHMRNSGYTVRVEDRTDLMPVKMELGVPQRLYSCHTGVIDGKVVEGHVPADVVRRYLDAGAPGNGLGVPGMPPGSPGMPSLNPQPYDVFSFEGTATEVFQHVAS